MRDVFITSHYKQIFQKKMDKLTLFINKYSDTLNYEQDAQLKHDWQNFIAPSCVNKVMVFGGMDSFYECFICKKRLLYQSVIMRHYREQHAAQMPNGHIWSDEV